MSHASTSSLLWINKNASNVHTKKHVAEVNAHVQKSGSKKRPPRKLTGQRQAVLSLRKVNRVENSLSTSQLMSTAFDTESESNEHDCDSTASPTNHVQSDFGSYTPDDCEGSCNNMPTPLIFSSYLEDAVVQSSCSNAMVRNHFVPAFKTPALAGQFKVSLPSSLDASNPLPGLMTDLTTHEKMMVHTHLTYLPQVYYGLGNRATYCPIRSASVTNMLRAPIGTTWVVISLEMFLETVRGSNKWTAAILARKSRAYQLMAKALSDQSQTDENLLLGPCSAAIAELFCGDPVKALTHLNGIDAFITARGGMQYIRQMNLTTSMPIFAISAYRTLLQDNLTTATSFQRARNSFMTTVRSLLSWNHEIIGAPPSGFNTTQHASLQDEGFDGDFDLAEGLEELQEAREQAFLHHPLLRKFVGPEFTCSKPGEKVDHFIVLFNLNRIIADHGYNFKLAATFIHDLVDDVETGGSTKGSDSSIKISGVLRLLTNRQARMYPDQPSVGVARAWDALDALEIMKLLPLSMQALVCRTLHALLVGRNSDAVAEQELDAMDSTISTEWLKRHPSLSLTPE